MFKKNKAKQVLVEEITSKGPFIRKGKKISF